jgi:hypothetical protein
MSGPGGSVTKRDQRRATRQQEYQQRQRERAEARRRELRQRQLTRWGLIGGGILIFIVIVAFISFAVINGNRPGAGTTTTPTRLVSNPATGQPVDGLTCDPEQGGGMHIHQYLELYINGQRVNADPGIGIPSGAQCLYPLHVHDNEANIIHNEYSSVRTFTLGQFFDIWGVKLSSSQVGQYKVDSAHKLVVEVFDTNGKETTYTGDPHNLPLQEHDTIYILYNSPNVKPVAWDGWSSFAG